MLSSNYINLKEKKYFISVKNKVKQKKLSLKQNCCIIVFMILNNICYFIKSKNG